MIPASATLFDLPYSSDRPFKGGPPFGAAFNDRDGEGVGLGKCVAILKGGIGMSGAVIDDVTVRNGGHRAAVLGAVPVLFLNDFLPLIFLRHAVGVSPDSKSNRDMWCSSLPYFSEYRLTFLQLDNSVKIWVIPTRLPVVSDGVSSSMPTENHWQMHVDDKPVFSASTIHQDRVQSIHWYEARRRALSIYRISAVPFRLTAEVLLSKSSGYTAEITTWLCLELRKFVSPGQDFISPDIRRKVHVSQLLRANYQTYHLF
jgi:hypothetical protein